MIRWFISLRSIDWLLVGDNSIDGVVCIAALVRRKSQMMIIASITIYSFVGSNNYSPRNGEKSGVLCDNSRKTLTQYDISERAKVSGSAESLVYHTKIFEREITE